LEPGILNFQLGISPSYGGIAEGVHLFPFRTEKLSPSWPMVLVKSGRVGSCHIHLKAFNRKIEGFFYALNSSLLTKRVTWEPLKNQKLFQTGTVTPGVNSDSWTVTPVTIKPGADLGHLLNRPERFQAIVSGIGKS
jgi:hypothetical protein